MENRKIILKILDNDRVKPSDTHIGHEGEHLVTDIFIENKNFDDFFVHLVFKNTEDTYITKRLEKKENLYFFSVPTVILKQGKVLCQLLLTQETENGEEVKVREYSIFSFYCGDQIKSNNEIKDKYTGLIENAIQDLYDTFGDLDIVIKGYKDLLEQMDEVLISNKNMANKIQQFEQDIEDKVNKSYVDNQLINKADKIEVNNALNLKADKTEIPSKVSQLENDSEYIDKNYVPNELGYKKIYLTSQEYNNLNYKDEETLYICTDYPLTYIGSRLYTFMDYNSLQNLPTYNYTIPLLLPLYSFKICPEIIQPDQTIKPSIFYLDIRSETPTLITKDYIIQNHLKAKEVLTFCEAEFSTPLQYLLSFDKDLPVGEKNYKNYFMQSSSERGYQITQTIINTELGDYNTEDSQWINIGNIIDDSYLAISETPEIQLIFENKNNIINFILGNRISEDSKNILSKFDITKNIIAYQIESEEEYKIIFNENTEYNLTLFSGEEQSLPLDTQYLSEKVLTTEDFYQKMPLVVDKNRRLDFPGRVIYKDNTNIVQGEIFNNDSNQAIGIYSHAEGYNTQATGDYSHVQGKYNIEDFYNKYVHIVGNGKDHNHRSNAHTVDWSGNAWYRGKVSVGDSTHSGEPTEANDLTTKKYVDDHIGNIETVLDQIIAIQNLLIGGGNQ